VEYLKAIGVRFVDDDPQRMDPSTLLQAAQRLSDPSFWPQHASLYPNANRVKNWLWIHSRYRAQADALILPDAQNDFSKWQAPLTRFMPRWNPIPSLKIPNSFDISMMQRIGNYPAHLPLLTHHDEDLRTVQAIREAFADEDSSLEGKHETLMKLPTAYVDEFHQHVQLEEESLVQPWLQLTTQQYKTYRSYLSWK
jgi:hypothetical protein